MKPFDVNIHKIYIDGNGVSLDAHNFDEANKLLQSVIQESNQPSRRLDFSFLYEDARVISVPFVEISNDFVPSVEEILSHHFGDVFADNKLLFSCLNEKEKDAIVYSRIFSAQKNPKDYKLDYLSEYSAAIGSYEGVPDIALVPELLNIFKNKQPDVWTRFEIFPHNLDMHTISEIPYNEFTEYLDTHSDSYIPRVNFLSQREDGYYDVADNRDNLFAIASDFPDRNSAIEFANHVFNFDEEERYYAVRHREAKLLKYSSKPKTNNADSFYRSSFCKTFKNTGNMLKADVVLMCAMNQLKFSEADIYKAVYNNSPQAADVGGSCRSFYAEQFFPFIEDIDIQREANKIVPNEKGFSH